MKFYYLKKCKLSVGIGNYTNGTNRKSEDRLLYIWNLVYNKGDNAIH